MKSCAIRCSPAKGRSKSSSIAVRSLCRIKIIAGYGTLLKNSLPLEQTVVAVEVVGRTTIVQGKSTFPVPLFSSPQAGSIGKHTVSCTSLVIHIFAVPGNKAVALLLTDPVDPGPAFTSQAKLFSDCCMTRGFLC